MAAAALALAAGSGGALPLADTPAALNDGLFDLAAAALAPAVRGGQAARNPEQVLLMARALHGQKRYGDMLALLKQHQRLADEPEHSDAYAFWLATAHMERGQWDEALAACRRLEDRHPGSKYGPAAMRLTAWAHLQQGRTNDALACFARFAERYDALPEGIENRLDWADRLIELGRQEEARAVLARLPPPDPASRQGQEHLAMLGRLSQEGGDWEQARRAYAPLLNPGPVPDHYRAIALLGLADIAASTNGIEAMTLLDRGLEQISDPAWQGLFRLRKGRWMLQHDKIDEGIALIRGFVAAQPGPEQADAVQMELAEALLDRGLYDKALTEFQNYLETFTDKPGTLRAQQGKGGALFHLDRFAEAAAAFEKAAESASDPLVQAPLRLQMGRALLAAGQPTLAIKTYAAIRDQWPETAFADQASFQIAECWARLNEPERARDLFWDLFDLDPEGELADAARLRIADLERTLGRREAAGRLYADLAHSARPPARAHALFGLGLLAYENDDYGQARAFFEEAGSSGPADLEARSRYLAAWCRVRMGQMDQALLEFRTFVDRYRGSAWAPDALFWLGEQDFNQGRYGAAESAFLTVAQRYPRAAVAEAALFWAGRAALLQHEYRRANLHLARLVTDYPSGARRPDARFYQGAALAELGEFSAAILLFDELIKQHPDHPLQEASCFRKGDSQFALGTDDPRRYEEALATYQAILDRPDLSVPSRLEAEYKMGRCLEKMGRRPDAFDRYMSAVYLYLKSGGLPPGAGVWFTRAAFHAAAIKESEQSWRQAAAIYQRVADAGVPAAAEALGRIRALRKDHWLFFY